MKQKYTGRVIGYIKKPLNTDIMKSLEGDFAKRSEVRRVFQQANRRIQNLRKAEVYSPALEALGVKGDKFAVFGVRGKDWQTIKKEYARAVSFLNSPTSTASGAREYNENIRQRYGLSKESFKEVSDSFRGKLNSLNMSDFVDKKMMRYKEFSGEFEEAFNSASEQLESDSIQLENALQKNIEEAARETEDFFNDIASTLEDGIDIF